MKLSKSFGQIFLSDHRYINKILDALDIEGEEVLEIGPGDGMISKRILPKAKFLYCIELDTRFCDLLKKKFKQSANIEVIQRDIIKFSFQDKFKPDKQVVVFGNVPYQISNEIVRYLVKNRAYIKRAYLTFQKEFVSKLTANPSTKPYGFLSCYTQFYAKAEKLFDIPARAFNPIPKVDSSFMKMDFYPQNPYKADNIDFLFKVIRQAFSRRRKKVINALPLSKDAAVDILLKCGIPCGARAQNLSLKNYICLAQVMHKKN